MHTYIYTYTHTLPPTDAHGGEEDGPEHHQDVAAVDVAGPVVDAPRVRFVVVRDLLLWVVRLRWVMVVVGDNGGGEMFFEGVSPVMGGG